MRANRRQWPVSKHGRTISASAQTTTMLLTIGDRGPGIPRAERTQVFEKFYRLPHAQQTGLPDTDGLEVCRQLRSWSEVPILVLSARYHEMEKVRALDLGADDYLTKLFSTHELLARIRVALQHAERRQVTLALIVVGDLRIDLARRRATRSGEDIRLTPTEYALLAALATQAGRVLTHTWLLQHVWGPGYEENVQNLHVFRS
jgi:two-component system KDP operon response regulator KdpE